MSISVNTDQDSRFFSKSKNVVKIERKKIEKSFTEFSTYHLMKAVCKILYKSVNMSIFVQSDTFAIFQCPGMAKKKKQFAALHCIACPPKNLAYKKWIRSINNFKNLTSMLYNRPQTDMKNICFLLS